MRLRGNVAIAAATIVAMAAGGAAAYADTATCPGMGSTSGTTTTAPTTGTTGTDPTTGTTSTDPSTTTTTERARHARRHQVRHLTRQ